MSDWSQRENAPLRLPFSTAEKDLLSFLLWVSVGTLQLSALLGFYQPKTSSLTSVNWEYDGLKGQSSFLNSIQLWRTVRAPNLLPWGIHYGCGRWVLLLSHFLQQMLIPMCLVAQLCTTLCNPMDYSHQAPLFMGFLRQEYWSVLPFPPPGDLPDPGILPGSSVLHTESLLSEPPLINIQHDRFLEFFFWWTQLAKKKKKGCEMYDYIIYERKIQRNNLHDLYRAV